MSYWRLIEQLWTLRRGIEAIWKNHVFSTGPPIDAQNHTGVIVKIDINKMLAQVVVKTSLLKQWYSYHKLTRVVGKGNKIELIGL
jgi:hypothetical protein